MPLTEEHVQNICERFRMKCNISNGIVFVTTKCGYWRIYMNGENVEQVFHSNYRSGNKKCKKKKKRNEGFHRQDISLTKLYDVLKYIHYHDMYPYVRKKTRVEILLEELERQRKQKEQACTDNDTTNLLFIE